MTTTTTPPKPRTFHSDLAHLPAALLPLTKLKRWVIWKWELKKDGKWTKPPFQARYPDRPAKSNDPKTWGTYEDAVMAFTAGLCDGIGLMLKDSELGAIDLDHIRNFATGEVLRWAEELFIEAANAGCYLEWTVSGTGARIIGIARGSELQRKVNLNRKTRCAVEFYRRCARYITISGFQISGDYPGLPVTNQLPEYDALFDVLYARFSDNNQRPAPQNCEFSGRMHISIEEIEDEDESASDFDFDFNDAGPQGADYQNLIENGAPEGERSEQFQRVVWHLAGQGCSTEQIAEELAKHPNGIGAKYIGRLPGEVDRSYQKWQATKRAAATGGSTIAGTPWPQIQIIPGEIPRIVNEAEDALLLLGREVYQRGGLVMRPVLSEFKASKKRKIQGWRLVLVSRPYLVDAFTCAARFLKYSARSKAWITTDAPDKVAEIYLARQGRWKLPVLTGIIHTPFLRADGSICEQPGYDAESGLLFKPDDQSFPQIAQNPSRADAVAALGELERLISTFPFVAAADRSVALSAILTTLDRRSMETAPLHAFTSPAPGTGKSLMVDVTAMLATGRPMPVISQGKNEEELEKRLGAALLAGDTAISLDNCDHTLEGSFLCQVLTQHQLNIRILGQSRNAETPVNATIFATGNNLTIGGDLIRRTLLCSMDAGCERPELRVFNVNAVEAAKTNRGQLVAAALTILRAWHLAASTTPMKLSPFGSFEEWSHRIREPLIWLDKVDPCETLAEVRKNDPHRDLLIAVIMQWKEHLNVNAQYTVQEVIERAVNVSSFYTALMNVAGSRTGQSVSNERLGRWLKSVQSKIVNNLTLLQDGNAHGYHQWKLIRR